MSELGLEPIRKRDSVYSDPLPPQQLRGGVRGVMDQMIADRRILLAEVERLRVELARRDQQITASIDERHLERQRDWSRATFGPGHRTAGILSHICKEVVEIAEDPYDVREWVDVIILALDGAWRAGYEPAEIFAAIKAKQDTNEKRAWPDWRSGSEDTAIEHVRDVS